MIKEIKERCPSCGGEIIKVNDFFRLLWGNEYDDHIKKFEKVVKTKWKESPNYNCCVCGDIFDPFFKPTGTKIVWLEKLKKLKGGKDGR